MGGTARGLPHRAAALLLCAVSILGAAATARAQNDQPLVSIAAPTVTVALAAGDGYEVDTARSTAAVAVRDDDDRMEFSVDPLPSDDATLSVLKLTDTDTGNAIGLDPSFARDVLEYAAEVAASVQTITLEATANHSGGTLKYMNGKEGALSDFDPDTDGFQVGVMVVRPSPRYKSRLKTEPSRSTRRA